MGYVHPQRMSFYTSDSNITSVGETPLESMASITLMYHLNCISYSIEFLFIFFPLLFSLISLFSLKVLLQPLPSVPSVPTLGDSKDRSEKKNPPQVLWWPTIHLFMSLILVLRDCIVRVPWAISATFERWKPGFIMIKWRLFLSIELWGQCEVHEFLLLGGERNWQLVNQGLTRQGLTSESSS